MRFGSGSSPSAKPLVNWMHLRTGMLRKISSWTWDNYWKSGALRSAARVEVAHKRISDEFSTDNNHSAIARLSRMLTETSDQIDKNLTLDEDGASLSRLKRELQAMIEGLATSNASFQSEVRATLAVLHARREEASRSTRHGLAFQDQIGPVIAGEAQRLNDLHEMTGATTGAIKNCKIGDFMTTLGPDSAAPGARIAWEVKSDKSYDLKTALWEIEQARKNRQAQTGIFVFASDAAPDGLQSVENEEALKAIDLATRSIEKQLEHLDQIKTWAETAEPTALRSRNVPLKCGKI